MWEMVSGDQHALEQRMGTVLPYSQYTRYLQMRAAYIAARGDVFSDQEMARLRFLRHLYDHGAWCGDMDSADALAAPIAVG